MNDAEETHLFLRCHDEAEKKLRQRSLGPPSPGSKHTFLIGASIGCFSVAVVAPWTYWGYLVPLGISGLIAVWLYFEEEQYSKRLSELTQELFEAEKRRTQN